MGPVLLTLICPPGADEGPISHHTVAYAPYRDDDGRLVVDVPRHIAGPLLRVGGFKLPPPPQQPPSSEMVRLVRIDGGAGGAAGQELDENGAILVPAEMAGELLSHGFDRPENVKRARSERLKQLDEQLRPLLAERAEINRLNGRQFP
jgi:hypothetical protein